jgi:hypothetical protein
MRSGHKEPFGIAAPITGAAPIMVISASAPHENNYEMILKDGTSIGSLTWILAKSLDRVPGRCTNKALFHQIRLLFARIHPFQHPQCEGETDHMLFSGEAVSRPPYFYVIQQANDTTLTLNGGNLSGLSEGALVGFFPPDTRNPFNIKPLTTGVVTSNLPMSATVNTPYPFSHITAKAAWVYILQPAYTSLSLNIQLDLPNPHPTRDVFQIALSKLPIVTLHPAKPQVSISIDSATSQIRLMTFTGTLLPIDAVHTDSITSQSLNSIIETLRLFALSEYLRHLEAESPALATSLQLIPISPCEPSGMAKKLPSVASNNHEMSVFHPGDLFSIEITNRGSSPIWFNLIDIQPDHQINLIMPSASPPTITIHDLRLEPGASYRTNPFMVNPPFGSETIKCISTAIPVDLSLAFIPPGQRPVKRGAPNHPLNAVLIGNPAVAPSSLRGASPNPLAATHVQTIHFLIQPKQQE